MCGEERGWVKGRTMVSIVHGQSSWMTRVVREGRLETSVATAIADVFRKNGINVGRKFAKIMTILDKIDDVKSRWVI